MPFYADLHLHSRHSRATSRDGDLPHLARWAQRKGLAVIGTGDFTHPGWFDEIREQLTPAEPGLFTLRPGLSDVDDGLPPAPAGRAPRFVLSVEISTIYKKGERTRKVHHLILVPDLEGAARLRQRLGRIGNLASDGRPILGLDSRDLLEIVLEAAPGGLLIPAHIWTPWFSALGSRSGFDSIDACYRDLAPHICAVETGLSSDPPMNARVSSLDRYRLVSSSDAHSPPRLGREASVFDTALDYFALRRALETGAGYRGTVEFFPEEGKYHLDGHRACGVVLEPAETRACGGLCPACGKPVTVGVLHRVEELADRSSAEVTAVSPSRALVPLDEVLAELEGAGAATKKVQALYHRLLAALGPELWLLAEAPLDQVACRASPLLAEALRRLRAGQVQRQAGYDGAYGAIRLFEPRELDAERRGGWLLELPTSAAARDPGTPRRRRASAPPSPPGAPAPLPVRPPTLPTEPTGSVLDGLDPEQRRAASLTDGPLLVVAGPGSGKTRTLVHRLAHLVAERGVAPARCLAITFTRRAAGELQQRLASMLGPRGSEIVVTTFHGLGLRLLRELAPGLGLPADFGIVDESAARALLAQACGVQGRRAQRLLEGIRIAKRGGAVNDEVASARARLDTALHRSGQVDLDDLLLLPTTRLEHDRELRDAQRRRWDHLCVDEYQDVDPVQVRLLQALHRPGGSLCAIGDPDQSIYGFRGADAALLARFVDDFEGARVVRLTRSYCLGQGLLDASAQVLCAGDGVARRLRAQVERPGRVVVHAAASERAEAEFVVHSVERLLGGHSFFSLDSARSDGAEGALGLADLAVLYRTEAQAVALVAALRRSGLPFQRRAHRPLCDQPGVPALVAALRSQPARGSVLAQLHRAAAALRDGAPGPDDESDAALTLLEPLALQHGDDRQGFVDALALGVEHDLWDPRAQCISLLTLHAAKGLEFAVVFIVGCEDGLLPLRPGPALTPTWLAAERRLFYVGMTRASRQLVLCHAARRRWPGQAAERVRSPFIDAIDTALLRPSAAAPARGRHLAQRQLDLF